MLLIQKLRLLPLLVTWLLLSVFLQDETEASEALELGIAGLRLLNSYYALQLRELKSLRHDHLKDCKNIKYSIGQVLSCGQLPSFLVSQRFSKGPCHQRWTHLAPQVFLHKRHGYRGVIYGWSPRYECSYESHGKTPKVKSKLKTSTSSSFLISLQV